MRLNLVPIYGRSSGSTQTQWGKVLDVAMVDGITMLVVDEEANIDSRVRIVGPWLNVEGRYVGHIVDEFSSPLFVTVEELGG